MNTRSIPQCYKLQVLLWYSQCSCPFCLLLKFVAAELTITNVLMRIFIYHYVTALLFKSNNDFVKMLCKWGGRYYSLSVIFFSFLSPLCCSLLLLSLSACSNPAYLFFSWIDQHVHGDWSMCSWRLFVPDVVFHQKCTCIYRWLKKKNQGDTFSMFLC